MAKKRENVYVLAVKNYEELLKSVQEGTAVLPGNDLETYKKLLSSPLYKATQLKELKKFIKKVGAIKKEVMHYWEGLMVDKYTLLAVEYAEGEKSLRLLCDGNKITLVE